MGAGPGDPGLLTLRGRACLEQADVVIHDELVHPAILDFAASAERIYVGKKDSRHSLPQEDINRILCEQARQHASVVRLKGGDPFVFGRGGEEALALYEAGIPFEVVPGVTAAIAAPAYAGIPVTHRGLATSVTFITGHLATEADGEDAAPDWPRSGTLCFYMGLKKLPHIAARLLAQGHAPETPVAVIEWGTFARQRTVTGRLNTIATAVQETGLSSPAMIVVGEVVSLRDSINWFEHRPLFGLRVVVTHTRQRKGRLETWLRELGAAVLELPSMEIQPAPQVDRENSDAPAQAEPLWENPGQFDWILLASVNAAQMLFQQLDAHGLDARALASVKIAVLGQSTEEAVRAHGIKSDLSIASYGVEEVLDALLQQQPLRNRHVLLPRADITRSRLGQALREAGAKVTEAVVYRSSPPRDSEQYSAELRQFQPHVLLFTNATASHFFMDMLDPDTRSLLQKEAAFGAIGPVTAQALKEHGFPIAIQPQRHDIPHLIEALCAWRKG